MAKKNKQVARSIKLRHESSLSKYRATRRLLARERRALQRGQIPARLSKRPKLLAPAIFEIQSEPNRTAVLTFLKSLRDIVVTKGREVIVDFSRTTHMVACGTLFFLAECVRIAKVTNRKRRIHVRRIADRKVREVLHQIGFFAAIGRRSSISPSAEDVVSWTAISGQGAEGEKADSLVQSVRERLPPALQSPMYAGLVEAMTNSKQHAYLQARRDGLKVKGDGEWWMFAREQKGQIVVLICDLGIGIPNSLPLTHEPGVVRELVAQVGRKSGLALKDATLVGAAIAMGRSRLREAHRGKGLQDVVDVIDKAGAGVLRIHSNSGCYTYQVRDGKPSRSFRNYRYSVLGTLIEWSVPARPAEQSNNS